MRSDNEQPETRSRRRRPGWILVALAALTLTGWAVTDRGTTVAAAVPTGTLLEVATRTAALQPGYEVASTFVGRVEAARSSDLGFELAGRVEAVWVDEGDAVTAGQRLAVLDRERLRSRRGELVAALDQATAGLDLARQTHLRVSEAAALDAVSHQEHDEARLELLAREAAVRQLEAQIRSLDVELTKSILRAPYDAIVAGRLVDEGEVVAAGRAVLSLLEASRLEARVGTAAELARTLTPGDALDVSVRGHAYPTRVKAILPDRESRTRTVTVLLTFEDQADGERAVRSGDLAEVSLSREIDEPGFWLPVTALTESVRGLWACYVAEAAEGSPGLYTLARRDVEVLHTETDRVFVRGTLQAGERVVTGGVHRLVPGQPVRLRAAAGSGEAAS